MSAIHRTVPTLLLSAAILPAADLGVQIHGFASQGYLETTNNDRFGVTTTGAGTFNLNEFGVNFSATPVDRLRIGAQIFAQSLGKYGADQLSIDWAYGEYTLPTGSDTFRSTVVAGRLKTGLALYNDYRDLDMTRVNVFLPESVYDPGFRDLFVAANGAQLNLSADGGSVGSMDVSGYVGGQNTSADNNALADTLGSRFQELDSITSKFNAGGYLQWNTPLDGLRLKGSMMYAQDVLAEGHIIGAQGFAVGGQVQAIGYDIPMSMNLNNVHNLIASAEYVVGDWTFAAEYSNLYAHIEVDTSKVTAGEALLLGGGVPGAFVPGVSTSYSRQHGAYGMASYVLAAKWQASLCGTYQHDTEDHDPVTGYRRSVVVALRFDPTDHWLIKGEFQRNKGTMGLSDVENPDGLDQWWNQFSLKTTFDF